MPTALIFGTSRGLGRALVVEHLKRGWQVIATVREESALADLACDALTIEVLDIADRPAVDTLRARLATQSVDLLFVVAGIIGPADSPIGAVEPEEFAHLLLVNSLSPLHILDSYADIVTPTGTLAAMSSGLGSITLNTSPAYEAYRISKAALNMGVRSIAVRHASAQTWLAVDPGWVQTDMGGPDANLTIDQSIPSLTDMLEARQGTGGVAFVTYANEELPW